MDGHGVAFTSLLGPSGGAVYNEGLLTLTSSSFDTNTAAEDGGAIYVAVGAEAAAQFRGVFGPQPSFAQPRGTVNRPELP